MWNAARCVEPEWLDGLRPDDPRAVRSRNDLRRVNACMLQGAIMADALISHCDDEGPRTLLDLGAGDGTFMLRVARRLAPRWRGVKVILLDRQDIVSDQTREDFRALRWNAETLAEDALTFLEQSPAVTVDVITANLFLHHFPAEQLARLFAQATRHTRAFVACEPRRTALALFASRMLWAIGCNDVSRHDAVVSVRAGFIGSELSDLWAKSDGWTLHERSAWMFTHCFAARRMRQTT
jgi:phospholipid N-methyltransferase